MPVLTWRPHRQDVPHDDAEADGQVDAAGHHRQRRGEREQRDDRLVGEDRAEVQVGREGVGQEQREEDDQQDASGSAGRRPAASRPIACQRERPASSEPRRLERVRLNGLHGAAPSSDGRGRRCVAPTLRRGGREQVLDREIGGGELGDHAAAVEDQRAVADLGDLLEVGRDDDDRRAPAWSATSKRR